MKKNALNMVRVVVVEPAKAPREENVPSDSWDTWYPLVDKTTDLFEMLRLPDGLEMLFDEEGRLKQFPLNVLVPALAPSPLFDHSFLIDMTNGRGMKPGEPGIGYHEIYGTFIVARRKGENYVDLTDEEVEKIKRGLVRAV